MELFFLAILILTMAVALGSGFPVAFALPGSAILTIGLAALAGQVFAGDPSAYFAQGDAIQWLSAGITNFRGVYWEVERDTLIAIPLFIFMGIMLQRSKLAEDLLVTMAQMFGPVPGGLGISVVFVGALLAATTGIVGATVVAMGMISLPAMLRNNYSHPIATGTIAASGTLGQIIPPSIVLIILADQLASAVDQASTARKELYKDLTGDLLMPSSFDVGSTSAGEMFLGAFVPGLVLVGLYMAFIMIVAIIRPSAVPTVRYAGVYDRAFAAKVFITLVPPLTLIFLVLGSIITGVATVNQAGAIGAAGALVMAGYRLYEGRPRQYWPVLLAVVSLGEIGFVATTFNVNIKNLATSQDVFAATVSVIGVGAFLIALVWSGLRALRIEDTLRAVMIDTAKTTSLVFIILIGAAMLTAAFRAFGGEELVKEFLTGLPGGFWAQFLIVMLVIFVLGFFLDFIEIAVVVVPIVAPILLLDPNANVTAVWLGVMVGLNIQTSFLTPPFGFALFYLRGVADKAIRTISMYKGVIPFIALQLLALVIVGLMPQMVNYLPLRFSLTSETAPPPRNPALQGCLEEHVFEAYREDRAIIAAAIDDVMRIDLSAFPERDAKELGDAFGKAAATFDHVAKIEAAKAALEDYSEGYRSLHADVRSIQRRVIDDKADIKRLETERRRLPRDSAYDEGREHIDSRVAALKEEIAAIEQQIPGNWKADNAEFVKLKKAEAGARNQYRRNVDQAYEPVGEMITILAAAEALAAFEDEFAALRQTVESVEFPEAVEAIKGFTQRLREIPATNDITKGLDDARRQLRGETNSQDREKALEDLTSAEQAFADALAWRMTAARTVLPDLERYEEAISRTIGLRKQDRLARDEALAIASCLAVPADLTLEF